MNLILKSSFITFYILLLSCFSSLRGQDSTQYVNFRVVNEYSGVPVVMAHVINITKYEATISDLLGYLRIPFRLGDTITISSLGYFKREIINFGQFKFDSIFFSIKLKPRSYIIKELKFTWFSNYESFLKGFLNLNLPITKEEKDIIRINDFFARSIRKLDLKNLPSATSGGSFGLDWLAKQNIELDKKLEKESRQRAIEKKFSAEIVEALTGLKGSEVYWFMDYCGFKEDYLLKASDYEIRISILDKYKMYKQDIELKNKK